jgi:hypothetical protein
MKTLSCSWLRRTLAIGGVGALLLLPPAAFARIDIRTDPAHGDADAQGDFEAYLEKCSGESPAFRDTLEILQRSARTITVVAGRNQPGVLADAFRTNQVDLDDLDDFPNPTFDPETKTWVMPAGVPSQTMTVCQVIIHFLWERYMSSFNGGRFAPGHVSGNDIEERVRRDYGQTGGTVNHTGQGGGLRTLYRNDTFHIDDLPLDGADPRPPPNVTQVNVICLAKCVGARGTSQFGGADCAACRRQADAYCAARGTRVGSYICRSK